ncbi:DUF2267 domain-containing protein [Kitasatospora sp. NPDC051914]|uniref:DUF2267 domain-containing protein n=1 Tax=Kitasatospora sp. NPDC051914 TaxID=3154945 RepID=UPI00344AB633
MGVSRDDFLDQVVQRGGPRDEQGTEHLVRVVLGLLAEHLVGADRLDLAGCLPGEYAAVVRDAPAADRPLSADQFVAAVAGWAGTAATDGALQDVGAVLGAVADLAGEDLLERLLLQLPAGYGLLLNASQRARPAGRT